MVALGWICQGEGCSAAYQKGRASDYTGHLKSRHKLTISTQGLPPPVAVFYYPPAKKGEGH